MLEGSEARTRGHVMLEGGRERAWGGLEGWDWISRRGSRNTLGKVR